MGVPLPELAAVLGHDPLTLPSVDITGITCDSRKVKAGFLFVAVPGSRRDGHAFIGEACRRGARAVVAEVQERATPVPCLLVRTAAGRWPNSRLTFTAILPVRWR